MTTLRDPQEQIDGGTTASERILMKLCRTSFLTRWSSANPYTNEGKRSADAQGTELVDVLVVFGDDVLLFSDKHCGFQDHVATEVAWRRWFGKAIWKSQAQLMGALSWLRRFPSQVFADKFCKTPIGVPVPSGANVRFHLIAVTRGSVQACSRAFGADPGTHFIDSDLKGRAAHEKAMFTVGWLEPSKSFVHVFDELSLEVLFKELDTITDFVAYLRDRHALLTKPKPAIRAVGEEQLVAAYILNRARGGEGFFSPEEAAASHDLVVFDGSFYEGLTSRPEYHRKKEADRDSYIWDKLIDRFSIEGSSSQIGSLPATPTNEIELGLRLLASEDRFHRRQLIFALKNFFEAAKPHPERARARVCSTRNGSERVYIFLVTPQPEALSDEEYRQHRVALLAAYCQCTQLRYSESRHFIGIAFSHPGRQKPRGSEDLVVWMPPPLTDATRLELELTRTQLQILGSDMEYKSAHAYEYPLPPTASQKSTDGGSKRGGFVNRRKTARKPRNQDRKR